MVESVLKLENIGKEYALEGIKTTVLHNISFAIHTGDMVAIVGKSGSGKSTLMNIVGLLDKADSGQYLLNNYDVNQLTDDQRARYRNQDIGFVFQQFNLLPRFTAYQNVALPLIYRNTPNAERHDKIMTSLAKVGLDKYSHHKPTQLSGGQQQRVAIARALVADPKIILADEPTGALDSKTGEEVMQLFHQLHQEGKTLMVVTHDSNVAAQCQRQIVLADGHIVEERAS